MVSEVILQSVLWELCKLSRTHRVEIGNAVRITLQLDQFEIWALCQERGEGESDRYSDYSAHVSPGQGARIGLMKYLLKISIYICNVPLSLVLFVGVDGLKKGVESWCLHKRCWDFLPIQIILYLNYDYTNFTWHLCSDVTTYNRRHHLIIGFHRFLKITFKLKLCD